MRRSVDLISTHSGWNLKSLTWPQRPSQFGPAASPASFGATLPLTDTSFSVPQNSECFPGSGVFAQDHLVRLCSQVLGQGTDCSCLWGHLDLFTQRCSTCSSTVHALSSFWKILPSTPISPRSLHINVSSSKGICWLPGALSELGALSAFVRSTLPSQSFPSLYQ